MKCIDIEHVIIFHNKIITKTGGSSGIRDISIIESSLNGAFATFDENKRIGVATMLLLLKLNEIDIKYTQDELVDLGLSIAQNKHREKDIEEWIVRHQIY